MGLGIDIVEIERITNIESLAKKILHEKEHKIFSSKATDELKREYLAGRFAAKEAFLKANGCGLGGIDFKDICILNEPSGKPYLLYLNKEYEVSISHERKYAIAIVKLWQTHQLQLNY